MTTYPRPRAPKPPAASPAGVEGAAAPCLYVSRSVKLTLVREPDIRTPRQLLCGDDAVLVARPYIAHEPRECFLALLLDTRHRLIAVHRVGLGGLDSCAVDPRVLWGAAVGTMATALVLAHNHPSGDPTPSRDDRAVTERAKECGLLLGIQVLDHVILGADAYWSLATDMRYSNPPEEP